MQDQNSRLLLGEEQWPQSLLVNAFHIFYYLVTGASSEKRQHLHLQEKVQDRYLGQRSSGAHPNSVRDDDTHQFEQLKVALKMAGLSK